MFCGNESAEINSFHNIFINGDWDLEKIKSDFGDTPTILTKVLQRKSCSVEIVKLLLKDGADINCKDEFGDSPLMIAIGITKDEAVIRELLKAGAKINMTDSCGKTPLLIYLQRENCSVGILKVLLDNKASINHKDEDGYSALTTAILNSQDDAVIQMLVEKRADVNVVVNGETPLLLYLGRSVFDNCSVSIVKLLLRYNADVNYRNFSGNSPLTTALINSRDEAIILALLQKGANANIVCKYGATPLLLYLSGHNCSIEIVKHLLRYNASINSINSSGNSPLAAALKYSRDEAVIQALLKKGARVNIACEDGKTPLLLYLAGSGNYSIDTVKLLLGDNADVNSTDNNGDTPLTTALKAQKDEAVIRLLLSAGAGIDNLDDSGYSTLCMALRYSSNDVVKLLLDAGSPPDACRYHCSALHCATDFSHSGLREDILDRLLETGINLNQVDDDRQSILCYALQHGAKARDIQLLLDVGASLETCMRHASPMICATCVHFHSPLRKDVVQLLLDNGTWIDDMGLKVLQDALRNCDYEVGAIQLLLDQPDMNAYVDTDKCLLHLAVLNPKCKLDALKLLISRNVPVLSENERGDTVLHWAVRNERCDRRVINLLLESGAAVNVRNKYKESPLGLAVHNHCHADVLKELLLAGACVNNSKFRDGRGYKWELFKFLEQEWYPNRDPELISGFKVLVKFFLLQNPDCDVDDYAVPREPTCETDLSIYVKACLSELETMDSLQVGRERTFRMFVGREGLYLGQKYDYDQIMMYLATNTFPVYFDVISPRIDSSIIEAEIERLRVYTNKVNSVERVNLNYHVVREIAKYLPRDDLLKFILAFYKPVNPSHSGDASKNDLLIDESDCKPFNKRRKLCS